MKKLLISMVVLIVGIMSVASAYCWPTDCTIISSWYGPRNSFTTTNGNKATSYHEAVDIAAASGTNCYAVGDGVIHTATYNQYNGNYVIIELKNGCLVYYLHLSQLLTKKGDNVTEGQIIGKVGATGNVTGPHLCFRVKKNGTFMNLNQYVKDYLNGGGQVASSGSISANGCATCGGQLSSGWLHDNEGNHYKACTQGHKIEMALHYDMNLDLECDLCKAVIDRCYSCNAKLKDGWKYDDLGQHYKECDNNHCSYIAPHYDGNLDFECDLCTAVIDRCYSCKAKLNPVWQYDSLGQHYRVCDNNHCSYIAPHIMENGKCIVCALDTVISDTTSIKGALFSDLPDNHWAFSEVKAMVDAGIVNGRGDGTLGTYDDITVEEFMALLSRIVEKKGLNKASGVVYLQDEMAGWSQAGYITLMQVIGAKSGETSGELGKKEIQLLLGNTDVEVTANYKLPITREKIANLMGVFVEDGTENPNNVLKAKDWNTVDSVYRGRINELAERDIFRGAKELDGIYIHPHNNIKRVEAIALINRLYNVLFEKTTPDNSANNKNYFDDALFIGDSRMVGRQLFGDLNNATFFAISGVTTVSIQNKTVDISGIGEVTLDELLDSKKFGKVYILLGVNDLNENNDIDEIVEEYTKLVNKVREKQPNAKIILEANSHVTLFKSDSEPNLSNVRINQLNSKIKALVDYQTIFYIDINTQFDDTNGNLLLTHTNDGLHLLPEYYIEWNSWIKDNVVI